MHDSDEVVRGAYSKPKKSFLRFLKKIGLGKSIKNKKIDKRLIREEVFLNSKTKNLHKHDCWL